MELCPNCDGTHKIVPPDGPEDSTVLFVGEALGVDEDRKGQNFIGKTGQEVNRHYMPLAGLKRQDVRVVNTVPYLPCTPKHKLDLKKPKHQAIVNHGASIFLRPMLESRKYDLIVPMGAIACSVVDPKIDLEMQHGIPIQTEWGEAFPMYHPAGGIYEPKKMLLIRTDWARLRRHLSGALVLPTDKYPNPDYRECVTVTDLKQYLGLKKHLAMAVDTETTKSHNPYCLTLSVHAGTGRLIRVENKVVLRCFQEYLDMWEGPILFHNWMFDGEVVEAMGLRFPWHRIVDTMVKVFHLGNLPQGLKALAHRELGMTMQDFDDLVTPYAVPLVLEYYRNAMCEEWSKPVTQLIKTDTGGWKEYKPHGFRTKLKSFWTKYAKSPEMNVFEQWEKNWEEHQEEVEAVQGPWPGKCISYCPFDKVLHYACRDADATLRLWPIIRHMERRVRRTTQERWAI